MRGAVFGILAGTALAISSTAANAALAVITCDPSIDNGCTVDNSLAPAQSSISWSDSNVGASPFSGFVDFSNTLGGNYFVSINSANPSVLFTALTITPLLGGPAVLSYSGGPTNSINLLPGSFAAGNYHLSFSGTTTSAGPEGGTLFFAAVPEPSTWALMLLGFGGIGLAMRRRRRPALAQVA